MLAGCGGGGAETPPGDGGATSAQPPSETKSTRTAPQKSVSVADRCSVVSADQARAIGADQAPEERESTGFLGCDYQLGKTAEGWLVFVSATDKETMQDFAEGASDGVPTNVGGYPATQVGDERRCLLSVDVSDKGSLYINTVVSEAPVEPCGLSKQFADAALKNLPNA
ncbi:DUF3558 domain-containing protein [Saccharopolyspora spinosporotrichia]|uniref:DUF3558 domain-containing protein n=1 Tax=Saccharopolyspora erythraea TaxID=1836 RepID=UPI0012F8A1DB|nr:DUF3558 domain-containing protein [Saccharopolyspora erythraea]QRK91847.1 DUF3558 domain-containing protein [Saccharopolyspora erythraea]